MKKVMIKIRKELFLIISFSIWSLSCYNQVLIPLTENRTIKDYLLKNPIPKKSTTETNSVTDTLKLPFFDDFSRITVFPDAKKWSDKYAFINATFPIDPISIGVATLDAIDDKGDVYNISDKAVSCDSLTSQPIDLSEFSNSGKKIYLSFFYQPKGNGEVPETKDSLVAELYSPKDNSWFWAWSTPGMPLQPFQEKIIEIKNSFFQKGFRFRFRNYVSMSDNDTKSGLGALGNFDIWNIDYVRLNSDSIQVHQTVDDVSFLYPLKSSYLDYNAIPWDHVDSANFKYRRDFIPITIRTPITNVSRETANRFDTINVGRGYYIKNLKTGKYIKGPFAYAGEKLYKDTIYVREDALQPPISYDGSDMGIFETAAYLVNSGENIKVNDTVKKVEYFQYHYAYDDGSPERGFGNPGPIGGIGSSIAVYFQVYRTDSLRAIDIYFNKTRDNYNEGDKFKFKVCVWRPADTIPGELLYISNDTTPKTGKFMTIILDSPIYIYDGIYIGIEQNTNEFLNIGYDINNKNKNKLYVNNFGDWEWMARKSIEDGTLMIRPEMSRNRVALGISEKKSIDQSRLSISPNPSSNYINLYLEGDNATINSITIYNMMGTIVLNDYDYSGKINVSGLIPGIYILKVTLENGKNFSAKFIKSR